MAAIDKPANPKDTIAGAFDHMMQSSLYCVHDAYTNVALRANLSKPADNAAVEHDGSLNFAKAKNIFPEPEALALAGVGKAKPDKNQQAGIDAADDWLNRQLKAA